jgi:hypothetical protein
MRPLRLLLVGGLVRAAAVQRAQEASLDQVLTAAAAYLEEYDRAVTAIVAEERYAQAVTYDGEVMPTEPTLPARPPLISTTACAEVAASGRFWVEPNFRVRPRETIDGRATYSNFRSFSVDVAYIIR